MYPRQKHTPAPKLAAYVRCPPVQIREAGNLMTSQFKRITPLHIGTDYLIHGVFHTRMDGFLDSCVREVVRPPATACLFCTGS